MARYHRVAWYDAAARTPDTSGHPLYVYPRQGTGRVDDAEHEYLVRYVGTDPAGCVAEAFGDFGVWTPALLEPPPTLRGAVRALVTYDIDARVCDLDDAKCLTQLGLRPSQVVSSERRVTQRWARQVFDSGRYDGVSWWSRRDARWTSAGLWHVAGATVEDVTVLDLDHPAVVEAAGVLLRRVLP
jgi:hypothetical protein